MTKAQIVSHMKKKKKLSLHTPTMQNVPNQRFGNNICDTIAKCIFMNPTIPNPHQVKVVGCMFKKNTLGLPSTRQSYLEGKKTKPTQNSML
jgi:hypothetical protein